MTFKTWISRLIEEKGFGREPMLRRWAAPSARATDADVVRAFEDALALAQGYAFEAERAKREADPMRYREMMRRAREALGVSAKEAPEPRDVCACCDRMRED